MLGKIEPKEVQNENGMVVVSECVDYVTLAHKNTESKERRNRAEYCFMFFDPLYQIEDEYNVFQYLAQSPRTDEYGMKLLEAISKDGTDIDFSTVTSCYSTIEEMTSSYAKQVSLKTNGINIEDISPESIVNESIEHIYSTAPDDDRLYEILIGTSYTVVNLKKPITEKYIENAIKYGHSYIDISEFDEEDIEDCADTDGDGLWDFQEIKVFKGSTETPENQIIWFEDGKLMLPTVNDMTKEVYKDIYSSEEIDAFREYFAEQYGRNVGSEFWNTPILPINSHPTEPDGDGDGILDRYDGKPLIDDKFPSLFVNYINSGKIDFKDVLCSAERDVFVCRKSISDLGFVAQITPLFYYDEYGDPVEFEDEASAVAVQQGFFTDWYILGLSSEAECLYTVIYSEDIVESVDSFNQPKFIKSIRRAVDKFAAPYKVIIESIIEDGVASTAKELAMGLASAFLEDNALKLGKSFGTLVDLLSGNIGYDSTGNFDNFNEFQFIFNLGNKTPSVKFENQLYRGYLNLEREYFDTENDVYKASKSIFCQLNCIVDLLTAAAGVGLSDIGTKTFIAGGAVTVLSDGSTAIVSIPAMIVGALASAQGYQIAVASVLTLAENVNTFSTLNNELSEGFKNGDLAANLKQAVKARIKKYDTVKYKYKLEKFDGYDKGSHSKILEKQLEKQGIKKPKYGVEDGKSGCAAHHIVPTNDKDCPVATELLKKYEIDKDSAANGVFLPTKKTKYVFQQRLFMLAETVEITVI